MKKKIIKQIWGTIIGIGFENLKRFNFSSILNLSKIVKFTILDFRIEKLKTWIFTIREESLQY